MPLKLALILLPPLCIACVVLYVADVPWMITGRVAAVLLVFLVVTALCDRVRHLGMPWEQEPAAEPAVAPPQEAAALGLGASAIAGLPVYRYKKKRGGASDECSVCLGEVKPKEVVKQLPACMHLFHEGCIDVWLRSHRTCPVCRTPVDATAVPESVELVVRTQGN